MEKINLFFKDSNDNLFSGKKYYSLYQYLYSKTISEQYIFLGGVVCKSGFTVRGYSAVNIMYWYVSIFYPSPFRGPLRHTSSFTVSGDSMVAIMSRYVGNFVPERK